MEKKPRSRKLNIDGGPWNHRTDYKLSLKQAKLFKGIILGDFSHVSEAADPALSTNGLVVHYLDPRLTAALEVRHAIHGASLSEESLNDESHFTLRHLVLAGHITRQNNEERVKSLVNADLCPKWMKHHAFELLLDYLLGVLGTKGVIELTSRNKVELVNKVNSALVVVRDNMNRNEKVGRNELLDIFMKNERYFVDSYLPSAIPSR